MDNNVVDLPVITTLDIDPDRILQKYIGELDGVVIMGYDKEGNEIFASSWADGAIPLWLMERLKLKLLMVTLP